MFDYTMVGIFSCLFSFGFYLQYPAGIIENEFEAKAAELNVKKGNIYTVLSIAILIAVYYKN